VSRMHVGRNWKTTLNAHCSCSMKCHNGRVLLGKVNVQLVVKYAENVLQTSVEPIEISLGNC
jgi:hypothetical protein